MKFYKPHIDPEEALKLVAEGELIRGILRVAKTDYTMAFVTDERSLSSDDGDYLIKGVNHDYEV